jgi:hypothetical protein
MGYLTTYLYASASVQTYAPGVLTFETVSVGASNSLNAVAARIPLPVGVIVSMVSVIGGNVTTGSTFNIQYGEGTFPGVGVGSAGTNAALNTILFASSPLIPASGTVGTFTPDVPTVTYPTGGELTLRISTPSGGGLGLLSVAITGTIL